MKKPLLNRQQVEKQIAEMWQRVIAIPDNSNERKEASDNAVLIENSLNNQLKLQDQTLPVLWEAACLINPENPLAAALQINGNADRLKVVLRSYNV